MNSYFTCCAMSTAVPITADDALHSAKPILYSNNDKYSFILIIPIREESDTYLTDV